MAITRGRKEELVANYTQLLNHTDGFIVAEYRGLTVAKVRDLRNKLRDASGATYSVTKNTLFRRALEQAGWTIPEDILLGPTSVIFGNGNLPAAAKVVQTFQKENADLFTVTGGVLGNAAFTGKQLEAIASLPTMDEIRAQIAGIVVQPASALAGLLQAANSQVVNVLQAYLDKNDAPAA